MNPSRDSNNDDELRDLSSRDFGVIDGPDDYEGLASDDDEDVFRPVAIKNIPDEEASVSPFRFSGVLRLTALFILIIFAVVFVSPLDNYSFVAFLKRPSSPDYVSEVLVGGQPLIFDRPEIRYSIVEPSGWPKSMANKLEAPVMRAIGNWENALKGKIKFVPAGSSGGDDLLIRFVTDLPSAGVASIRPGNRYRPEIRILTDVQGQLPESATLETVACHEIGHALGLWGHSDYPGDCMYPIAVRRTPSPRDIKTIRLLYGFKGEGK